MGEDLTALAICSDPKAIEGLRVFLLSGLAVSICTLMIGAWKALPGIAKKPEAEPICPLHKVVRSQCEAQHEPPAED